MWFALVAAVLGTAAAAGLGVATSALIAHDPISTKVTWEGEIKRLVDARCVSCHSPEGRAPMSLTTYEEARPWARAIREEVLTRRMPKWHVVRGYGDFTNDPSLSPFEVALFAAWADGGAPRTLPLAPAASRPPVPSSAAAAARVPFTDSSGDHQGPDVRAVTLPCSARALPAGRLVGLKPLLEEGADLRVIVTQADGTQEPLLWLRRFDPAFAPTYWLRTPVDVTRATRVTMESGPRCRVTVLLAARTGR